MSEVHISLSEFDAIRNSQKEGQDRIKELEKIISEKDDLITKLESNSQIIIKTHIRYLKPILNGNVLYDIINDIEDKYYSASDKDKLTIALHRCLNHPNTKFEEASLKDINSRYQIQLDSEKFVGFEEVQKEIEDHFAKDLKEKIEEVEKEKKSLRDKIYEEVSETLDAFKYQNQKLEEQLNEAQEKLKEASKSHEEKLAEAEKKFKEAADELEQLRGKKSFWKKLFG